VNKTVKKCDVLLVYQLVSNQRSNVKKHNKKHSEEIAQRAVSSRYGNIVIFSLSRFRFDFYLLEKPSNSNVAKIPTGFWSGSNCVFFYTFI
jgi:hypothetical protein